ncbi:ABC transporter permease [Halomonas sp. QX-2]|jgi:putative ABC transport system permease protein|uniref:ABC transporter permease n=1 Tax=Vreelandella sedimenti TaxID=2729618 RepID=A0A7Z0N536_9GAMM|nr:MULTISPECIES: ABC transporter permease [Halomonas]NYT71568.1 ABC transporter permease [Halomonas sedimenti]|tara:strand:- start:4859 stop:7360 length:2502 start_codon:yes stop_codon:yes gene_type:complete
MIRVLSTLLSHYRRHPGQLIMLLLGLWVASALWSGIQAINATARDSYARADALFDTQLDQLERRDGTPFSRAEYHALRQAGLPVSPMLEGEIITQDGTRLTLIGIDPLTLSSDNALAQANTSASLSDFLTPPWQTRVAPDTLAALEIARENASAATPTLADGKTLPPLVLAPALPPDTLIMDIAAAARLLESGDQLTRIVAAPGALAEAPPGLTLTRATTLASPGQLTESFHLNLTALGLLAWVVGLFIVQAALGLALEQRLGMLRTLRVLGVSGRSLVLALSLELFLLGLFGALAGIASGVWLARSLLPDVAATLNSLYGAGVGQELNLPWHYWVGGLAVSLAGLLLAGSGVLWRAARLNMLELGQMQAWRSGYRRQLSLMSIAGALALSSALALYGWLHFQSPGDGLVAGFGLIAALLLASALLLPPFLALVLKVLARLARRRPLIHWALADMQLQLPRLSLAMMALLIALATNLGVGSMVGGFRLTFLDWLDQRLVAPLYLNAPTEQYANIDAWLADRQEVFERLLTRRSDATLQAATTPEGSRSLGTPIELYGITPGESLTPHWPLLATQQDRSSAWAAFSDGAIFINEQLATAENLSPGDRLTLSAPGANETLTIAAIYPDYGNPSGQVLMASPQLAARFDAPPSSMGLVLSDDADVDTLRTALRERFDLGSDALSDQREIKRIATEIFERTFTITRALNVLTLAVAALALLASLLTQARSRRQQLAPLWALGVPRALLAQLNLAQLSGAALATGLLAIPLGIAITWGLVAIINVAAFGWRLPLYLFPGQMAVTLATAVGVALLAAALPTLRFWRASPRALLAEEANQ